VQRKSDGVELADSVVVNPHKWMLVPTDCSLVWTARPEEWREAFALTPEYLRADDEAQAGPRHRHVGIRGR
jgi:aromatic-L-amino-acid decarboxylase